MNGAMTMRVRTPTLSAEMELQARAQFRRARVRGRDPKRIGGFGPLMWEGDAVLPVGHPLSDSPAEARAKRAALAKQKRSSVRERDPWW